MTPALRGALLFRSPAPRTVLSRSSPLPTCSQTSPGSARARFPQASWAMDPLVGRADSESGRDSVFFSVAPSMQEGPQGISVTTTIRRGLNTELKELQTK